MTVKSLWDLGLGASSCKSRRLGVRVEGVVVGLFFKLAKLRVEVNSLSFKTSYSRV